MKTFKKAGIYIVLAIAVFSIAYKLYDVKQQKKNEISLVNQTKSEVPVTIITAGFNTVNRDIIYHGTFEPSSEVTVVSESQGIVKKYSIEEGGFISEGEIIAWLDNDLTGYQLETAEAAYLKSSDDLSRFENLSPGEAVSKQQLEEVKLAFKNAKSTYLTIKKQYENGFIKSPISGTVSKRYFEKGSFIVSGSPVADIIDTRKMKFNASFTAADLTKIKAGHTVELSTDLYPGVIYDGTIKVVGVKPDLSKRYLVQAKVKNIPEKPLMSGIDGTIRIENKSGQKNLVIPRNCIVGSAIQPMVYVVSDNKVKLRAIVVSEIVNNLAVIESGLAEGENVVLSGQINLEDNARVTVLTSQIF